MTTRETLAQEWRERLEDFAEAEMTVQQWCDFNRLSSHQYYYWRRRLAAMNAQANEKTPWMPLDILDITPRSPTYSEEPRHADPAHHNPSPPTGITIRIAGAAIDVTRGFDPGTLRAIVQALGTQSC